MAKYIHLDYKQMQSLEKRVKSAAEHGAKRATKEAIRQAAQTFLNEVTRRTPVQTGELALHWRLDNASIRVMEVADGYQVTLKNKTPYASWVENGHYSYNQFNVGGTPYEVKHRTVPYTEGNSASTFVFGTFFVRKTELAFESQRTLDSIVREKITTLLNKTF